MGSILQSLSLCDLDYFLEKLSPIVPTTEVYLTEITIKVQFKPSEQ